jgi:predicted lipoprotein with Yx(FWY)xxD motif
MFTPTAVSIYHERSDIMSAVRVLVAASAPIVLFAAGCAMIGSTTPVSYSAGVMVNAGGMTLYTFDKDPAGAGKSVCNAKCAGLWPPLFAAADGKGGGDFSIISRDDGHKQWAYRGKPLYLWSKDQKPGDRTGDGFNGVWHVVKQPGGSMGY